MATPLEQAAAALVALWDQQAPDCEARQARGDCECCDLADDAIQNALVGCMDALKGAGFGERFCRAMMELAEAL